MIFTSDFFVFSFAASQAAACGGAQTCFMSAEISGS